MGGDYPRMRSAASKVSRFRLEIALTFHLKINVEIPLTPPLFNIKILYLKFF